MYIPKHAAGRKAGLAENYAALAVVDIRLYRLLSALQLFCTLLNHGVYRLTCFEPIGLVDCFTELARFPQFCERIGTPNITVYPPNFAGWICWKVVLVKGIALASPFGLPRFCRNAAISIDSRLSECFWHFGFISVSDKDLQSVIQNCFMHAEELASHLLRSSFPYKSATAALIRSPSSTPACRV